MPRERPARREDFWADIANTLATGRYLASVTSPHCARVFAIGLAALSACGQPDVDRSELRRALLLEDGRTAVVAYSHRLAEPDGASRTVLHRAVLARCDVESGKTTPLVVVDLGTDRDADSFAPLWSRGHHVLLHAPLEGRPGTGHALLDAEKGAMTRLDLERELGAKGTPEIADVRIVAPGGWLVVRAHPAGFIAQHGDWYGHLYLREPGGDWVLLAEDATLSRVGDGEIVYGVHQADPPWQGYRLSDGHRHAVHPRDFAHMHLVDQDRPNLLQVRPPDGTAHMAPYLVLARGSGASSTEHEVTIDLAPLRR